LLNVTTVLTGGWLTTPATHTSCVQASPSPSGPTWLQLQPVVLTASPPGVLGQVSLLLATPSLSSSAEIVVHTPLTHVLVVPQLVPGGAAVNTQPVAGLHASIVHGSLSLQLSGVPGLTTPFWQVSVPLHRLPSFTVIWAQLQPLLFTPTPAEVPGQLSLIFGMPSPSLSTEAFS
jgi:hypothetical protein